MSISEGDKKLLPKITYDKRLLDSDVSYQVEIDQDRAGQFLAAYGMPKEEIEKHTIIARRTGAFGGTYDPKAREIGLNCDSSWYGDTSRLAWLNAKPKPDPNATFLHEAGHAIRYATGETSLPRRVLYKTGGDAAIVLGSVGAAIGVGIVTRNPFEGIFIGTSISGLGLSYRRAFDPEERAVREFVAEAQEDGKSKGIVTLEPKAPSTGRKIG